MAWQLVYTSAPRLLEVGRTGFGTVARHRELGAMVVGAVERVSQFTRLPGYDPRRVIFAHRRVHAGAHSYHVFTSIRDAGSDYTGRTNHLAHHVVATAGEVAALKRTGITPGDVLEGVPWRTAWSEAPRYLDAAEEIDLLTCAGLKTDAWKALLGIKGYASMPMGEAAGKGLYLILPPQIEARPLFAEALSHDVERAWQTTFTTSLQPTDDVADFRWIGVEANSPLRPNPNAAVRAVLDLTDPESLPDPARYQQSGPASNEPSAAPAFAASRIELLRPRQRQTP